MPPGRKKTVPGEEKDRFPCTLCSEKFTLISTRNRHIKNMHKAVSYCTVCQSYVESGKDAGKEHAYIHTTTGMACGCCHWVWDNQKDLRIHRKAMAYHGFPGMVTPIIRTELKAEPACHPRFYAQRQKILRERGQPDAVVSVRALPKKRVSVDPSPPSPTTTVPANQNLPSLPYPLLLNAQLNLSLLYLLSCQQNSIMTPSQSPAAIPVTKSDDFTNNNTVFL